VDPASAAVLTALATHGLPGALIAALLAWLWFKDRELSRERDARVADARYYNDLSLKLQERSITVAENLTKAFNDLRSWPRR
jgi:hypothetical protein